MLNRRKTRVAAEEERENRSLKRDYIAYRSGATWNKKASNCCNKVNGDNSPIACCVWIGPGFTVSRHNPVNRNLATFQIGNWLDPEQRTARKIDCCGSNAAIFACRLSHALLRAEIRGDVSTRLFATVYYYSISAKKGRRETFSKDCLTFFALEFLISKKKKKHFFPLISRNIYTILRR